MDIAYGSETCRDECSNPDFACNHPECRNYLRGYTEPESEIRCAICNEPFRRQEEAYHLWIDGEDIYYHIGCFDDEYRETIR